MKLKLRINFQTDGDYNFIGIRNDSILDSDSPFYNGVIKKFLMYDHPGYEEQMVWLECEGDANSCRYAARDIMEHLIERGIRVVHYWIVKYLYDLIIGCKEKVLWAHEDVHYRDTISGNYEGTYIELDIVHEGD